MVKFFVLAATNVNSVMILLQKWLTLHSALPGNGLAGLNLRLQHGARGAASQGAAGMAGMGGMGQPAACWLIGVPAVQFGDGRERMAK